MCKTKIILNDGGRRMNTITIDGKTYKLVPLESDKEKELEHIEDAIACIRIEMTSKDDDNHEARTTIEGKQIDLINLYKDLTYHLCNIIDEECVSIGYIEGTLLFHEIKNDEKDKITQSHQKNC